MKILFCCICLAIALVASLRAQEKADATVTDIDGNVYKAVTIGTQVWMAEDLRTTRYRHGEPIGTTFPPRKKIREETAPKYQWAYAVSRPITTLPAKVVNV